MSANLDIIKAFLQEFGCGSIDVALGYLADDATWSIVQTSRGVTMSKEELGARLGIMRSSFKDAKIILTPIGCVEEKDRLSIELESFAETVLGTFYENKYCTIFTMEGGKITDVREYNDSLHIAEVLVPAISSRT